MSMWGGQEADEWGATGGDAGDLGAIGALETPTDEPEDTNFEETDLGPGFPDATQSVRIWLDEEGHLLKVRMSNAWRDRARGTSLSSMFDQAFLLAQANLDAGDDGIPVAPESTSRPVDLTWDELAKFADRLAEIDKESERLRRDGAEPTRLEGTEVEGSDPGHHAHVTLDVQGRTSAVRFDEHWLASSRVSEVCRAVEAAHRDAYRRHTPPTLVLGDHARLAGKSAGINRDISAMLTNIA